MNKKLHIVDLL